MDLQVDRFDLYKRYKSYVFMSVWMGLHGVWIYISVVVHAHKHVLVLVPTYLTKHMQNMHTVHACAYLGTRLHISTPHACSHVPALFFTHATSTGLQARRGFERIHPGGWRIRFRRNGAGRVWVGEVRAALALFMCVCWIQKHTLLQTPHR